MIDHLKSKLSDIEIVVNDWVPGTSLPPKIGQTFLELAADNKAEFIIKLFNLLLAKQPDPVAYKIIIRNIKSVSNFFYDAGDLENSIKILLQWQAVDNKNPNVLHEIIQKLDKAGLEKDAEGINDTLADTMHDSGAYLRRARNFWEKNEYEAALLDIQRSLTLDPKNTTSLSLYRKIEPERVRQPWIGAPAKKIQALKTEQNFKRLQIAGYHNSGISWLSTVLFQLGFYVTGRDWGHWVDLGSGNINMPKNHQLARRVDAYPGLREHIERGSFAGQLNYSIEGGHMLPSAQYASLDTVLIYRNLMSVLWSLYKRRVVTGTTFDMNLRDYFSSVGDLNSGLGALDSWAIYYLLWINLYSGENLLLISFDEGKRNPTSEIKAVLSFMGEQREDAEILKAVDGAKLDKKSLHNKDMIEVQVGHGSIDDYLEVFSHNDEKWITGLPRNIWDYFEGRWRGNIVDISFTELIDGLSKFEGQLVPELDHLCEAGNISIAHDLAFSQSNSQDGNAVFVFAVHSTRNLIDTKTTKEGYAFLDENFIRALKVYLYAYQNLMSPALLLAMAERHLISEREKRE